MGMGCKKRRGGAGTRRLLKILEVNLKGAGAELTSGEDGQESDGASQPLLHTNLIAENNSCFFSSPVRDQVMSSTPRSAFIGQMMC